MNKYFLSSLRGYRKTYLKNDLLAGVIVAALTIPVAMGYAGVAGLPPVYGLYASILPTLAYALFASSGQLIFGMDAAASAVIGMLLPLVGITALSQDALAFVPVVSFFAAVFLIVFALLRLGRFASFISLPVMSGFISGLSISIIVGQVPKLLQAQTNGSDFFSDIDAVFTGIGQTNLIALVIGVAATAAVLLGKKYLPKWPMGLIVLVVGTALTAALRLDQLGVAVTGAIPQGLPALSLPDFANVDLVSAIVGGLLVSIVIFASSVLAANSFALQSHTTVDDDQELRAYGIANFLAAFVGSSPACASVSRTAASAQFGGKTQVTSLVAAGVVAIVVAFLSGLLYYMPQSLLAGIIIAALVGVVDVKMFKLLHRRSRAEWVIWIVSALAVLLIGILIGVLIGVMLSFLDVAIRAMSPPRGFLGVIPGRDGYFDLSRHKRARPVDENIVLYRFTAPLFFANIQLFRQGLNEAAKTHPRAIVVDASGIFDVDTTAADELKEAIAELKKQNIELYFAGQIYRVNDELARFGLKDFVESGHTQKTVEDALKKAGATIPAPAV